MAVPQDSAIRRAAETGSGERSAVQDSWAKFVHSLTLFFTQPGLYVARGPRRCGFPHTYKPSLQGWGFQVKMRPLLPAASCQGLRLPT